MKGIFISLIPIILIFNACSKQPGDSDSSSSSSTATTQMKVVNSTSGSLGFIKWYDNSGNYFYFGNDQWVNGSYTYYGLFVGHSDTQNVGFGSSYLYFYFDLGSSFTQYRTANVVTIPANQLTTFTFTGSTMIQTASIYGKSTIQYIPVIPSPDYGEEISDFNIILKSKK